MSLTLSAIILYFHTYFLHLIIISLLYLHITYHFVESSFILRRQLQFFRLYSVSHFLFFTESSLCLASGYSLSASCPALQWGQEVMSRRKMAAGCWIHWPVTRPEKVDPHWEQRTTCLGLLQTGQDDFCWAAVPGLLSFFSSLTGLLFSWGLNLTSWTLGVRRYPNRPLIFRFLINQLLRFWKQEFLSREYRNVMRMDVNQMTWHGMVWITGIKPTELYLFVISYLNFKIHSI